MYLFGGRGVALARPDNRLSHGIDEVLRCAGCLVDVGFDGGCCAAITSVAVGRRHGDRSSVVICEEVVVGNKRFIVCKEKEMSVYVPRYVDAGQLKSMLLSTSSKKNERN